MRNPVRSRTLCYAITIAALAVPLPALAVTKTYVGADGGSWNLATNWSPSGVPANGDSVFIQNSATDLNVFMNSSYAAPGISGLNLNGINGFTMTVTQSGNAMYQSGVNQLQVGSAGRGRYIQSGGTNYSDFMMVGAFAGAVGAYELSGSATFTSPTVYVGHAGTGTFTQTGGTSNITVLYVGASGGGGSGSYSISSGSLTSNLILIGSGAPGSFQVSGGTVTANNGLNVGPTGVLNFSSGAVISPTGFINDGTINQSIGSLSGPGTNNSTFTMSSGNYFTQAGGFTNNARWNISGGTIHSDGPTLNNGQIILNGNATLGGSAAFNNYGDITQFSGNLTLNGSGPLFNSGNFSLAAGGGVSLSSNLTNTGTLKLNGGHVIGTATLVNRSGGTIRGAGLISSAFDNQPGGRLLLSDGTMLINNAFNNAGVIQLTDDAAGLNGGTITNSAKIFGHGIIGNGINNSGEIVASGGTLLLTGALTNLGIGSFGCPDSGALELTMSGNAGLINLSGGSFDDTSVLSNTGQISGFGNFRTGGLTNNGSVTFTGGFTTVQGSVVNSPGKQIKIAYDPALFTGNVTNNGVVKTTSTTVTFSGTYTEAGTFISDPSDNYFSNVNIVSGGAWVGGAGDRFFVSGSFVNQSTNSQHWDTHSAELHLLAGAADEFAVNGRDLGVSFDGYDNNFAWGTLSLAAGRSLTLLDADQTPGGAIYVNHLDLQGGIEQISAVTGNGMTLYYSLGDPRNAYLEGKSYALAGGGSITPVPEPAAIFLSMIGAPLVLMRRGNRWRRA